jgi:Spy/CpxP family protein refolding chaperone
MSSKALGLASLALGLALTLAGGARAQQNPPNEKPAPDVQAVETDPDMPMESMQDMMEDMQGMMMHMQDMMAQMQGTRSRHGMMADDQDDETKDPRPRRGMMRHRGMMGHGAMTGHGGMVGRHLEHMIQQLDLTEEQQSKIRDLVRPYLKDAIRIRADIGLTMVDLHDLLEADSVEIPKVKELFQSIASQKVDLHIAHLTLMQEISKLLTPEQKKQFRTLRHEMRRGHGGMMHQDER